MKRTEVILIIDDEPAVKTVLVSLLNYYGWTNILEAANGQEGVKMIKEHNPDLVITDLTMPVMRGEKVLEWMKLEHRPLHPSIKAMAISGDGHPEMDSVAKAAGADDVLHKPFVAKALKRAVDALFESKS